MKVLLINDQHQHTGGAENYFFNLKSRLKNQPGIEVYSLGFSDEEAQGEDFYVFKAAKSSAAKLLWRVLPHFGLYRKLKIALNKIKPDIVHIHNVRQYNATVMHALKDYPIVQTVHDHGLVCPFAQNIHRDEEPCATGLRPECFWEHQLKANRVMYLPVALSFLQMKAQSAKYVKQFITVSPGLEKIISQHFSQRVTYVPPFRTPDETQSVSSGLQPNHFLFAGQLGKHKGIHILLREFALAAQRNADIRLSIAGSGAEERAMKKLAHDLGIANRVRFLGWQTNLEKLYPLHQALVFPSIGLEGFPLVITEAMSHGRAVIGVNRGTTAWLVEDGETGLLFDPLKEGDLAEKLLLLAGNTNLATSLGKKGQQRIANLIDNEKALQQILAVYEEVNYLSS